MKQLRILFYLIFLFTMTGVALFAEESDEFDQEINSALEDKKENDSKRQEIQRSNTLIDRASIPNILVAADMVGQWDATKNDSDIQALSRDTANMREVEFGFNGAVDQWGLGSVLFAVHNENGKFFVELHEAYFEFNQLPWNLFFKVGKYFIDAGRLNSIHRHDWRFTQAPRVHKEFFDFEAVDDFGGELSILMPWNFYQEIKLGVFSGKKFGHAHDDGITKAQPLFTARIKNFIPIVGNLGSHFGFSYLRYNIDQNPNNYWQTGGTDVTFKWQSGKHMSFEWTSEFWYRNEKFDVGLDTNKYGYYSFVEFQPWQMWFFGVRFDEFVLADNFDPRKGKLVDKIDYGQTIWITLKPSEFSYFRLSGERQDYYGKKDNYLILLQADFILGHHPAHRY